MIITICLMNKALAKIKQFFGYQDLTRDTRPIVTMILFAIPLVITAFANNGMSLLNSIVLKHTVGGDSVTAINQTSSLSSLILQFGFGCTSGFGIVIANLHGAKNYEGVKKAIVSSMLACVVIWLVLGAIGIASLRSLLNALHVNELYYEKAYLYFAVVLSCYIFNLLSNLSGHILRALGNSFVVLFTTIFTLSCQVGVCFLLTSKSIGNLDTVGAGLAIMVASLLNVIISFAIIFKKYKPNKESFKFGKTIYKDLFRLGVPIGFQWSILFIGSFVVASQVNLYGVYASKGMAVYTSWEGIAVNSVMGALGTMMVNFVGQNYGAKKYDRVKRGIRDGYIIVLCVYALILAITLPTTKLVPYIYLPYDEVNERVSFYATTYLYITLTASLFQGILTVSRGALQGIKKPLFPFISGIGELIARISVSLLIPYLVDQNYKVTLSDQSYIGLSFSNASAWLVSMLVMGGAVFFMILNNKSFGKETDIIKE